MRIVLSLLAGLVALAPAFAYANTKVAVFVDARAYPGVQTHVEAFEQLLVADLTQAGFEVIDRSVVAEVVPYYGRGQIDNDMEREASGETLDATLQQNTTAQRLAQNLGAAYLVHAALLGIDTRRNEVKAYGYDSVIETSTLRASVKVVNGTTGSSILATNVEVTDKDQGGPGLSHTDGGVSRRLLAQASAKVAREFARQAQARPLQNLDAVAENAALVINPEIRDLFIPAVSVDENGQYVVGEQKFPVVATGVTVQMDGLVIGSAPGSFDVSPGLHHLTVTRDDLKPWVRTVKVSEKGMSLRPTMELTDAALARWQANARFLEDLKSDAKLTDGEAEMLRGLAQMYRQSGFKVDIHRQGGETSDVNLDLGNDTTIVPSNLGALQQLGFDQTIRISNED